MTRIDVYSLIQTTYKVKNVKLKIIYHFKETDSQRVDIFSATKEADGYRYIMENGEEFEPYDFKDAEVIFFEATKKNTLEITAYKEV